MTEMGEFLVGAWLKEIKKCDFIQYDARLPENNLSGLNEVDVIGLDLKNKIAYLCEVTTHVRGVHYGTYQRTLEKIRAKFERDKVFADRVLKDFPNRQYMFWSPVVPQGDLTNQLTELEEKGVQLVINEDYAERIEELKKEASDKENSTGNPAFRLLQILAHVKKPKARPTLNELPRSDSPDGNPIPLHKEGTNPARHYVKGMSCPKFGDQHTYVPIPGTRYAKCSKCNSTRTLCNPS